MAARPPPARPVVAVIFERREVLLQLPVRLLEPLAQVLELAAERGLEGRVLGVHARAAPARPRPPPPSSPAPRPSSRRPALRVASFAPSLPSPGEPAASALGGTEEGEKQVAEEEEKERGGRWGPAGSDREPAPGTAGMEMGGPRPAAPPRRGGPKEVGGAHPSAAAPGEGEGAGGVAVEESNARSPAAQGANIKGHPRYCLCWEKEETGGESRKENGAGAGPRALSGGEGHRLEAAVAFRTTDSSGKAVPLPGFHLMQKHFKR